MYKLCQTETGLIGMVPVDTMVGDSVYIFTGGPLPFILRPNARFGVNFKLLEDVIFMEL